jgi:outer membrane PBP1 activator LpoA protein
MYQIDPSPSPSRHDSILALRALAATCCLAILLAACAGSPSQEAAGPYTGDLESLPPDTGEETIYTARLDQAEALLAQRQLLPAASILRDIDNSKLTAGERARSLSMETEMLYLQGDTETALHNLEQTLPVLGGADPSLRYPLEDWYLRLVLTERGALAAARLADQLLLSAETGERATPLQEFIWHNLQRASTTAIEQQLQEAGSGHWSGWLELGLLVADVMESPDMQVAQLELWRERHPEHRAAEALPGGLEALVAGAGAAPARIAILLPLSDGPRAEGQALLQGYLAALYEGRLRGWPEQELMVMDSTAQPDFNTAYETAVRAGADLVVGPLTAGELANWQPGPGTTVPLMTLAWHPGLLADAGTPPAHESPAGDVPPESDELEPLESTPTPPPPVQLGLASTDEARQLAQLAYDSGARNALIIKPAGDWGDSMGDALIDSWSEREGEVQAIATYTGQTDYSSSLKSALQLNESEARAKRMRQLLGERTEFTPRRRKDIDIVFLLSDEPQDARSIKPLIAFHYAGDLPVYATSHVFSGKRDPQRDRDLNGIRLLEMPWLLTPEGRLQGSLVDESAQLLADMHALGADAYMLNWRLAQLRASRGAHIRGNTGLLSMDDRGRVHRELVPARMENGVPEPR